VSTHSYFHSSIRASFFSFCIERQSVDGKSVAITGITGQDGSYLVEFLLEKGYQVRAGSLFEVPLPL
jgi:hypothetical protein